MSAQPVPRRFIALDAERFDGWVEGIATASEDITRALGLCGLMRALNDKAGTVSPVQRWAVLEPLLRPRRATGTQPHVH